MLEEKSQEKSLLTISDFLNLDSEKKSSPQRKTIETRKTKSKKEGDLFNKLYQDGIKWQKNRIILQ